VGVFAEDDVMGLAREFRSATTVSLTIRTYTVELLSLLRNENKRLALISNTESLLTDYDLDVLGIKSISTSSSYRPMLNCRNPHGEYSR